VKKFENWSVFHQVKVYEIIVPIFGATL